MPMRVRRWPVWPTPTTIRITTGPRREHRRPTISGQRPRGTPPAAIRGTLYSKVLLPDSVYDEVDYCPDITIESADCDGTVTDSLYDLAALEKKDKYELFLGGNYAKAVLRTGVENGKHLLLIKDSFANSLVPFLCGDYETITMVDLRYCREKIQPLADEADDVLVLYEITNFAADGNLFKLNLK